MDLIVNALDEPRVLYDIRKRKRPTTTVNATPTFITPERGTHAEFMNTHCQVFSKKSIYEDKRANHGFLIEPSSASYSLTLLPLMSQTKLSPCFSDILFPSAYHLGAENKYVISSEKK